MAIGGERNRYQKRQVLVNRTCLYSITFAPLVTGVVLYESSGLAGRRCCFFWESRRFWSIRRRTDARVGRVGLRGRTDRVASTSSPRNFSRQSAVLRPASRNRWLTIRRSPSLVMRRRHFSSRRWRTGSGKLGLFTTDHRSSALVFTLLTFCPPGPPLRAKVNSNSRSGICSCAVTVSMGGHQEWVKFTSLEAKSAAAKAERLRCQ